MEPYRSHGEFAELDDLLDKAALAVNVTHDQLPVLTDIRLTNFVLQMMYSELHLTGSSRSVYSCWESLSMSREVDWETLLNVLSKRPRRRLLVSLLDQNPQDDGVQVPEDVRVRGEELERLQTEFVHVHLPQLESVGFIEWDRENHTVCKGPKFGELRPLLEIIHSHRDELPDGWL